MRPAGHEWTRHNTTRGRVTRMPRLDTRTGPPSRHTYLVQLARVLVVRAPQVLAERLKVLQTLDVLRVLLVDLLVQLQGLFWGGGVVGWWGGGVVGWWGCVGCV